MALAITLRDSLKVNLFRDIMINMIESTGSGHSAILCSGFFQENFKSSLYQASKEPNFIDALKKLDRIKTVGIHNNAWLSSYKEFKNSLHKSGVKISAYYKSGLKWHAKVFLLLRKDKPIFGIIGSSNITSTAFGAENSLNHPGRFNFECDVYLWPDSEAKITDKMNELLQDNQLKHQIIRANYNKNENYGLSEAERLTKLMDDILNDDLKALQ